MSRTPTVVAVCGSRRDGSYTRTALRTVLDAAAEAGATTDMIDLGEVEVPMYDPDAGDQGVGPLLRRVREADAVVLGSPVYHDSYTGALKNFHDFCGFDEYEDTVVGLLAVAGGTAFSTTLDHMRGTVRGVHGFTLPHQVGVPNVSDAFETRDGERVYVDPALRERVERLGRELVAHAATPERPVARAD